MVPSFEPVSNPLEKLTSGKFYVDEIYDALIVKPITFIAKIFETLVDILMVNLLVEAVASVTLFFGSLLKKTQSGKVGGYAFLMFGSIVLFAIVYFIKVF